MNSFDTQTNHSKAYKGYSKNFTHQYFWPGSDQGEMYTLHHIHSYY